ncbi:hypothetical protein GQX74_005672 [Glossina fuscipes]|nr:hypothetical protein GQX74_005672 [Glossina fuscipes]
MSLLPRLLEDHRCFLKPDLYVRYVHLCPPLWRRHRLEEPINLLLWKNESIPASRTEWSYFIDLQIEPTDDFWMPWDNESDDDIKLDYLETDVSDNEQDIVVDSVSEKARLTDVLELLLRLSTFRTELEISQSPDLRHIYQEMRTKCRRC